MPSSQIVFRARNIRIPLDIVALDDIEYSTEQISSSPSKAFASPVCLVADVNVFWMYMTY